MALHSLSTRPLYLQLRDALVERIATGKWKSGKLIPNEGDLAREFGVSLSTMRRALDVMEDELLIVRQQGRGTFVNDPASDGLLNRFSKLCGTDGKPLIGRVETSNVTEGRANEAECLRLQLSDQDAVWRMCRTRFHNDQVLMREEVSLPAKLFPDMDDRGANRIVALAQQHGLLLGEAQERISMGAASREAAETLNLAQGSPVIVLDRVVHTIHGQPAEWRVGQCHLAAHYYLASIC
jgi:GntR family transcriptional regulator